MPLFDEQPELLQRFRDGDCGALEALYRRYFIDVFRLLCRGFVSGNPPCSVPPLSDEQARDHLQEVFLRAFDERARMGYDGLRPYRPYLLRITKNYRIDVARRERRLVTAGASQGGRVVDIDRIIDAAAAVDLPDYEETLHFQTRLSETQCFIAELSELEQTFVQHRFVEGLSQEVVATRMGVTRRRVRTLEEQIQRQLQRHLAKRGLA